MITISTHNGDKVSIQHNLRNKKICEKQPHIDLSRVHENWVHEDIAVAYSNLFDKAVADYNAKQTRTDRQIENYYKHVKSLSKAQHKPVYEMIIGVYNSHIEGDKRLMDKIDENTKQQYKKILREFVDGWAKANPSLHLIGAYYHEDEEGTCHCHLDYVPVGTFTRGMSKRVSMHQALIDMGYIATEQSNNRKSNPMAMWNASENKRLESICNKYGLKIDHPDINVDREYLSVDDYKRAKEKERQELLLKKAYEQDEKINKNREIINRQVEAYNKNKAIFPKQKEAIDNNNLVIDNQINEINNNEKIIEQNKKTIQALDKDTNLFNSRIVNLLRNHFPAIYNKIVNHLKKLSQSVKDRGRGR